MVLPLALHYCWYAQRHRNLYRAGTVLIALALPLTVSRSAVAGAMIVLMVLFVAWPPRRRAQVLLALPFLVLLLKVMIPGLLGAFRNLFVNISGDPSTQGRTDDYAAVHYYFAQNPWFGRGVSTFIPELYRTLDNAYLGWLLEVGLVGLVTLVGLMACGVGVCLHVRMRSHDEKTRDLAAALVAALLSGAFNFATFDALAFAICAGVFFLLLGAAGALWRLDPGRTTATRPPHRFVVRHGLPAAGAVATVTAILLAGGPQTRYQADGAVLLEGPPGSPTSINPYAASPYLDLSSEMAQRLVTAPSTVARLHAEGLEGDYTVASGAGSLMPATDRTGRGPLIRIQVLSRTPTDALAGRDRVVQELRTSFANAQLASGAPVTELIRVSLASRPEVASERHGHRNLALAAGAALGWAGGFAGQSCTRRRRTESRD
nr:O-antigen ligase family protein [Kineosporia mesophila]